MADPLLLAVIGAFGTAAGGTGMWAFLQRSGDRVVEREEKEIDRLRERVKDLEKGEQSCREEVAALKERVSLVEHHHSSYLARWIKDATKRVTWLNDRAFLSIFAPLGLSREDVLDKTFAELGFDKQAAEEIDRLDQAALAHPEIAASNVIRLHPLLPLMVIVKVAAIGRESELIYEGYAYRTNDRMLSDGLAATRQIGQIESSAERVIDGA